MELQEAILKRRSIRKYTDYYVTDDEIKEILEAARWAPSWVNFQIWEFVVIRDREMIEKVTSTYTEKNPAYKCSFASSVLIAACAKKKVSGCFSGVDTTKFSEWFMFDMGLTVQNLCLKAHELGLGTVVVGSMNHDACNKVLSVPDDHEVVVVIPVGKPVDMNKKPTPRKEQKDFVHLNTFGEKYYK